ncbi:MAG TPA: 3-isopropylmalate dehydratase small subunit [Vicinamibacterales bacterium]|nr:3-isopropylmalate dehydratase small subunit [Vicinamibacterales bacterium]
MAIERIARISGPALPIRGDNIDTDRIIPARFLKSVSFEGLEDHLFEDDRRAADARQARSHPASNPAFSAAAVMLVNKNFGCGSSREHAPQAIRRRGIRAIVGESYSEIFFGNSIALGMPCVTASYDVVSVLMARVEHEPSTELVVDLESMQVRAAGETFAMSMPAPARDAFLKGTWDATALLLADFHEVHAVASRLPYVKGWG